MKTFIFITCSLFFYFGHAQNISFNDSLLKGALINAPEVGYSTSFIDLNGNVSENVDANNDGEISVEEAQNIEHIDLYYLPFTDLEGLQFFTNLKSINSLNSYATTFNFPDLINLETLSLNAVSGQETLVTFDISNNLSLVKLELAAGLTSTVDLSSNINLRELQIRGGSSTTNINLSNLVNLRKLIYYGNIPTLDLTDCIKLIEISIGYVTAAAIGFSSIDLSNQPLLANLYISNTQITSLDLSNNVNLDNVFVPNNLLQNINFGGITYVRNLYCENNQLTSLDLNSFQNLDVVSCANNNLTELKLKNFTIEDYIDFSGNPNLAYICCDAEQEVYIQNQALINDNFETIVNSDCESNGILNTEEVSSNGGNILFFPNPSSDFITFSAKDATGSLSVFDVNGRLIRSFVNITNQLDISFLENGVYLLKTESFGKVQTAKLLKY